LDMSFLQYKTR